MERAVYTGRFAAPFRKEAHHAVIETCLAGKSDPPAAGSEGAAMNANLLARLALLAFLFAINSVARARRVRATVNQRGRSLRGIY
jgi:hypothetical protein